jgi:2-dehydropantoate 2-reductase
MRIAIMGSGGIGGYYGGRLALAGNDVTFIARGAHLEAMRTRGLRVESTKGDFALPAVQVTEDPAPIGAVDLLLMATKTYDLDTAVETARSLIGPQTTVLPLLNGVDIAERISAVVGPEHVLGGLCVLSSAVAEPGVIRHVTPFESVVFGELSGETTPRCQALLETLKAAGINATLSGQIRTELWKKFVMLATIAGVCCAVRHPAEIVADPDVRALFSGSLEEIAAVARAQGVLLPDTVVQDTLRFFDGVPPGTKPSMLVDLEAGRRLEVEAINGAVVRLGAELGVPTPVNRFLYAALKPHAAGA